MSCSASTNAIVLPNIALARHERWLKFHATQGTSVSLFLKQPRFHPGSSKNRSVCNMRKSVFGFESANKMSFPIQCFMRTVSAVPFRAQFVIFLTSAGWAPCWQIAVHVDQDSLCMCDAHTRRFQVKQKGGIGFPLWGVPCPSDWGSRASRPGKCQKILWMTTYLLWRSPWPTCRATTAAAPCRCPCPAAVPAPASSSGTNPRPARKATKLTNVCKIGSRELKSPFLYDRRTTRNQDVLSGTRRGCAGKAGWGGGQWWRHKYTQQSLGGTARPKTQSFSDCFPAHKKQVPVLAVMDLKVELIVERAKKKRLMGMSISGFYI